MTTPFQQSPSNQAENFVRMAELAQESFDRRRSYEWKVSFSLWGSIAILVYASVAQRIRVFESDSEGYCISLFILLFYLLFLIAINLAHGMDKKWKHYYLAMAEGVQSQRPTAHTKVPQYLWVISQMGFSIILLYLAIKVLSSITTQVSGAT